jgi:hypothetical protein
MMIVQSLLDMLQVVSASMTTPSQQTFVWIAAGWLLARRRTITAMISAVPQPLQKHWSCFHRFFSQARWSLDALGLAMFGLLQPFFAKTLFLVVDDTLARKRGKKIFGVGWHHDPLLKNVKALTSWGHSWVILGVVICFPGLGQRSFCLPILFRLYLNQEKAVKHRRVYRSRPELALEMLQMLCQHHRQRRFHLLGDAAYGGRNLRDGLPPNCDLTSYLRLDARLYAAPPARGPGKGRPKKRGERLPTPATMLEGRARRVTVDVYGRHDAIRLADTVAHTFHHPNRPVRVVAIESLSGKRGRQAFYSTAVNAAAEEILAWYSLRWTVEVAFQCAKGQLGFEEPPSWSRRSVERTAPMAMLLYGLVVFWFATYGCHHARLPDLPWYPHKREYSFADMLAALRRQNLRTIIFSLGLAKQDRRKIVRILQNTAAVAA